MTNINKDTANNLVIACIDDHPEAVTLLHIARRKAQELGCQWRALYIETPPSNYQLEDDLKQRILRLFTHTEQMGGKAIHIEAKTYASGLESFLDKAKERVCLVIIGKPTERANILLASRWNKLARVARNYTKVEIVPLAGQAYHYNLFENIRWDALRLRDFFYSLLAVFIAYVFAKLLQWALPPALFRINDQNVTLLFMIACAFVASRFGLVPGLLASLASFLTVNYYFTLPYYALKISTVTELLNMVLFLSAAILISVFTSQIRSYAKKAASRERSTQALFTLYRSASETNVRDDALSILQKRLESMLEIKVAFFLPKIMDSSMVEPVCPANLKLTSKDQWALESCWKEMKTTGIGSPSHQDSSWRFEPMVSSTGEIGVFAIQPIGNFKLDVWFARLFTAIADQTGAIIQQIGLERSVEETRLREEREKLRSMLLSSLTHDFKTPLAGIIGALTVYRSLGRKLSQEKRDELIETAIDEAQRLDNFITNIFDMTRLETGNIQFRKEWHNVKDMLGSVTKRMLPRCKQHHLKIHPCPANVEVCMDILMTEQVLQNVIDNACKYTKPGTHIEIKCSVNKNEGFLLEIRDFGLGIPTEKLESIFNKYTRLEKRDSQVAGTGLGLAIAKAVMEAQGGWVKATNHPDGGAVFTLYLPQWRTITQQHESQPDAPFKQAHSGH